MLEWFSVLKLNILLVTCVARIYHSMSQAVKAFVHCQHLVALEEPDPDSWTNRSIHSSTRSSHIQYGNVDVTLAWTHSQGHLSRLNVFSIVTWKTVHAKDSNNCSSRPLCLGGAREPAFGKCSSCSQSSYWQKIEHRCTDIWNSTQHFKMDNTKVHASLSPEFHRIFKPPFSHGCGDVFSLM